MSSRVGTKGNIVIDKRIRERLGIEPGWEAIQVLRDGHVELHFFPPTRPGASAGILASAGHVPELQDDDALHAALEQAAAAEVRERFAVSEAKSRHKVEADA